ncbi:hypothetical protein [Synechococcus phage S-H38]|uniref:Uncharacterized protein n=1 Tax=Synechococcus phage S-H38 TaxID=2783673 RepID=A0A873WDH6_9CAUD|nr:hypothetical protein PQC14_gp043 [Synechococcus phage S-H38]QPB08018.1 hypothetical protein [Synechococcus phage S-H38]
MDSSNDNDIHPDIHHSPDHNDGTDLGSEESQTLEPPVPNVIMLGLLFLATLATIWAGYIHGKMHLLTTLKNAYTS